MQGMGAKKGPDEIWDVHVHLFPEDVERNWARYAEKDSWFGALTREGGGVREAWCTVEEALAAADAAGIWGLVMQGWYWNDPGLMRAHNDFMAQAMREHPGRLMAFGSVNPAFGEAALAEAERCCGMGFCGLGELGPGGNGYGFEDVWLRELVEYAAARELMVCIHCGEMVGHDYPGRDKTPLEGLVKLIGSVEGGRFLLAHLGGGLPFYELNRRVRRALEGRVWYDTAALPLLYDLRSLRVTADLVGADRILLGSDFPLTLYPRECRQPDFSRFLDRLREAGGLTEEEEGKVLGENWLKLTGKKKK